MGAFIGIQSYDGALSISFTVCREMMPDPGNFAQCLQDSFAELHKKVCGGRYLTINDMVQVAVQREEEAGFRQKKPPPRPRQKAAPRAGRARPAASSQAQANGRVGQSG